MDKLEDKVEDKLIEELSEEIARRAFRPIDDAMDDMLRSTYEGENGGEVDWNKAGQDYANFLSGLNEAANVPASYEFNIEMEIEMKDGEKEKHTAIYYFSGQKSIMGIKQLDGDTENLMVIDSENDVLILYTEENGKKKAQAVPSAMKMAGNILKMNQEEMKMPEYEVEKTGKTKKYAGYKCDEYKLKSQEDEIKMYVAGEFPVSFKTTFGELSKNFLPENYNKSFAQIEDGMVMFSQYKDKENKKYNSTFEVKKVNEKSTVINNSEYGLSNE